MHITNTIPYRVNKQEIELSNISATNYSIKINFGFAVKFGLAIVAFRESVVVFAMCE